MIRIAFLQHPDLKNKKNNNKKMKEKNKINLPTLPIFRPKVQTNLYFYLGLLHNHLCTFQVMPTKLSNHKSHLHWIQNSTTMWGSSFWMNTQARAKPIWYSTKWEKVPLDYYDDGLKWSPNCTCVLTRIYLIDWGRWLGNLIFVILKVHVNTLEFPQFYVEKPNLDQLVLPWTY